MKETGWDGTLKDVDRGTKSYTVRWINSKRSLTIKTCFTLPESTCHRVLRKLPFNDSSELAKVRNEFLLLNSGLGNRCPRSNFGIPDKICFLCGQALDEIHILCECPDLGPVATALGHNWPVVQGVRQEATYSAFWDIWNLSRTEADRRARVADKMRSAYFSLTKHFYA